LLVAAHYLETPAARALERLTVAEPLDGSDDPLARLQDAAAGLDRLARALERPDAGWLTGGTTGVDGALEALLVNVRDVAAAWGPPFDPARSVEQLRATGLAEQAAQRERLAGMEVFGVAPALVRAEQGLALAPPLARARVALAAYLEQPLLRDGHNMVRGRPSRPDERLIWDAAALRELLTLAEGTLVADSRDLAGLPPELARLARQASAPPLETLVDVALSRAQTSDPATAWSSDRGLQREARAFATAEPLLTALSQTLELAGLPERAAALQLVVVGQARRLLAETDEALERGAPYAMLDPGLGSWDGAQPLRLAGFGAGSSAELAASLPGRRAFVERLAQDYAEPLLGVLAQSPVGLDVEDEDRVARWSETLAALDRYRRNDPTSSLVQLERLLTTGLDQVSPMSCGDAGAGGSLAWDYFAEQLHAIQWAIAERCAGLAAELAADRYARLAAAFNATLAGRFPFVGTGEAAAAAPRAEADEVRRFFREQDTEREALTALLPTVPMAGVPEAAGRFLADLGVARAALAPMLDPPVMAPLSYEIDATFRAEPTQDRGGNQILEWSIETDGGRLSSLGSAGPVTWTAGQPVRVALRWARNAPSPPTVGGDGMPRVDGPVAVFEYRDAWALLSLLRIHAAHVGAAEGTAHATLGFTVPFSPNAEAAPGGPAGLERAEVFLRVRLTALTSLPGEPVRRTPLPAPRFPEAAPELVAALAAGPLGPRQLTIEPAAGP
jgi:type VI secretion system protein ImpL